MAINEYVPTPGGLFVTRGTFKETAAVLEKRANDANENFIASWTLLEAVIY